MKHAPRVSTRGSERDRCDCVSVNTLRALVVAKEGVEKGVGGNAKGKVSLPDLKLQEDKSLVIADGCKNFGLSHLANDPSAPI